MDQEPKKLPPRPKEKGKKDVSNLKFQQFQDYMVMLKSFKVSKLNEKMEDLKAYHESLNDLIGNFDHHEDDQVRFLDEACSRLFVENLELK